ncbi:hypothetical protein ABZP36_015939 [Zizania latifolia]
MPWLSQFWGDPGYYARAAFPASPAAAASSRATLPSRHARVPSRSTTSGREVWPAASFPMHDWAEPSSHRHSPRDEQLLPPTSRLGMENSQRRRPLRPLPWPLKREPDSWPFSIVELDFGGCDSPSTSHISRLNAKLTLPPTMQDDAAPAASRGKMRILPSERHEAGRGRRGIVGTRWPTLA